MILNIHDMRKLFSDFGTTQLSARAFEDNTVQKSDCEFSNDLAEYMTGSLQESQGIYVSKFRYN